MSSYGTGDFFEVVVKQQKITQQKLRDSVPKTAADKPSDPQVKDPYEALLDYRDLVLMVR